MLKRQRHWKHKLNLNAVECNEPFAYKPKVPPYPYEQTASDLLDNEQDCPLVDVSNFNGPECRVEEIRAGDVVKINSAYALVRSITTDQVQIQLASSCMENTDVSDYGIRVLDKQDVQSVAIAKRDHEILHLTMFDVAL